jgi:putative NADH-flavin reductase
MGWQMADIIVFGAGGRTGRTAVAEALRRGHRVTAVVRDVDKYADLAGDGVRVVAGDVTDAAGVATLAKGHDAAIAAVFDPARAPEEFFVATAHALLDGLAESGVGRLAWVGLASLLPSASGELLMDRSGYPQEYRSFFLAHDAGAAVFRDATTALDWFVLSPSGDFDHQGERTGAYRRAPGAEESRVSYPDFAIALLDEIEAPTVHRAHVGVEDER